MSTTFNSIGTRAGINVATTLDVSGDTQLQDVTISGALTVVGGITDVANPAVEIIPTTEVVSVNGFNGQSGYLNYDADWDAVTPVNTNYWRSVAYGTINGIGLFAAVAQSTATNNIATSPDGINWTFYSTANTTLRSITYGNGLFVAVATGGTNRALVSSDGITWTPSTLSALFWYAVTYGNGMFVAIAYTGEVGVSTDGVSWAESQGLAATTAWLSITYGNGVFVAVKGSRSAVSTNGVDWTETQLPVHAWQDVAFGNGIFVAVASSNASSEQIMTSTDGISWTVQTGYSDAITWRTVTYGNGLWVVLSSASLYGYSQDGINWSYSTAQDSSWYGITYGKGCFVAVGNVVSGDTATCRFMIKQLSKWTLADTIPAGSNGWYGITHGVVNGSGLWVTVGLSRTSTTRAMTSPYGNVWTAHALAIGQWTDVAYGNGVFVAVGITGSTRAMTSVDGVTWVQQAVSIGEWFAITFGNGVFVAVTKNGSTDGVMTSVDGVTWNFYYIEPGRWENIAYGNGTFVAVTFNGGSRVATSTDNGETWSYNSVDDRTWSSITYGTVNGVGLFVAVSGTYVGNDIMTSPDGTNWTYYLTDAHNLPWNCITYGNGMFIGASTSFGTHTALSSSDGVNWEVYLVDPSNAWSTVAYGGGTFLALAHSAVIQLKYDFIWEPHVNVELGRRNSIAFGNGVFAAVFGGDVATTQNGIDWTFTLVENSTWTSIIYANGMFVAVASAGTNRVMTSTDGETWTFNTIQAETWNSVTYGNGVFVAVAYSGESATSSDGVAWASVSATGFWRSVTYGNGVFVAVGDGSTNNVMSSTDGISWTDRSPPIVVTGWASVAYGNGLFVAVALSGTNRVMTSPDGETWVSQAITVGSWNGISYINNKFVAVGSGFADGKTVMTSHDGISWDILSPHDTSWKAVAYGNDTYVVVSSTADAMGVQSLTSSTKLSSDPVEKSVIKVPSFTAVEESNTTTANAGSMIYNTTLNKMRFWNGSLWVNI